MRAPVDPRLPLSADRSFTPKVIGNGLRELDRFLSLLIDEVAAALDTPDAVRGGLREQRNTANKLRRVAAAMGLPSAHHERLRAIGRSRDCLFHCAGIVRRADAPGGDWMTAGWMGCSGSGPPSLRRFRLGERLAITAADLKDVCDFYDRVAGELLEREAAAP